MLSSLSGVPSDCFFLLLLLLFLSARSNDYSSKEQQAIRREIHNSSTLAKQLTMVSAPIVEGRAPFAIPSVKEECFTYYKIIGDIASAKKTTPLICIHGGPSVGHEYLLCFGKLWFEKGIPVILYDQIGCASSTHLRDTIGDESLWRESLFLDELKNLISHLKLERYHILGHSWGACLGAVFASTRTKSDGLQRLILFSPMASLSLQNEKARELLNELPPHLKDAIIKHDDKQEYDKAEYEAACVYFYKKHAYRDEPFPREALASSFANMADDETVIFTM